MTREKAIERLKWFKEYNEEDYCGGDRIQDEHGDWYYRITEQDFEAFDMAIKVLEQEPTTKNDLGVDLISRADALDCVNWGYNLSDVYKKINELTSVTPQEPRWIPVSERLPEEHICDDGFHEPSKSVLVMMKSGAMHTARYWSRYDERWLDLNYPTTDEVIAWQPLPKAYSEVEE